MPGFTYKFYVPYTLGALRLVKRMQHVESSCCTRLATMLNEV